MEPWQNWALVGVVGAGIGYYYTRTGQNKRPRGRGPVRAEQIRQSSLSKTRTGSKDKRKKQRDVDSQDRAAGDATDLSSNSIAEAGIEGARKKKNAKKPPSKLAHTSAVEVTDQHDADAEVQEETEIDNLEFARQLNNAQVGTSLKKPEGPTSNKEGKKKSNKARKAAEATNGTLTKLNGDIQTQELSRTSSTTGGDADDDMSPVYSPELGATSAANPSGADVSDMLEQPTKGPSVLRLTESQHPESVRGPKPKKVVPEPETKKQRQHRRKREEQRAAREEAEKERRVLLEKQLRTAREAEGRPARNGVGSAPTPTTNAWKSAPKPDSVDRDSSVVLQESTLLDTLDDDNQRPVISENKEANGAASSQSNSYQNLPSEEEQLRILNELDSDNAWSTVDKGGKAKKKAKSTAASASLGADSSGTQKVSAPSRTTNHFTHDIINPQPNTTDDNLTNNSYNTANLIAAEPLNSEMPGQRRDHKVGGRKWKGPTEEGVSGLQDLNTEAGSKGIEVEEPTAEAQFEEKLEPSTNVVNFAGVGSASKEPMNEVSSFASKGKGRADATDNAAKGSDPTSMTLHPDKTAKEDAHLVNSTKALAIEDQVKGETATTEVSNPKKKKKTVSTHPVVPRTREECIYWWQDPEPEHSRNVRRWAKIKRRLDRNVWNHDNIHEHPDFSPEWPYALIGHPKDSEWEPDDPKWFAERA